MFELGAVRNMPQIPEGVQVRLIWRSDPNEIRNGFKGTLKLFSDFEILPYNP